MVISRSRYGSEKVLVKKDRSDAYSSMRIPSSSRARRGSRPNITNDTSNFSERYYRRRRSSSLDAGFKFYQNNHLQHSSAANDKDQQQEIKGSKNKFLRYLASSKRKLLQRTSSSGAHSPIEEEKPWSYYKHSSGKDNSDVTGNGGGKNNTEKTMNFVLTQKFIGWKV